MSLPKIGRGECKHPRHSKFLERVEARGRIDYWQTSLLIEACLAADKPARALVQVEKLLRAYPDKSHARFLHADVLWALGRKGEAQASRERAQDLERVERGR